MGKWQYSSTLSLPRYYIKINSQLEVPALCPQAKWVRGWPSSVTEAKRIGLAGHVERFT